MKCLFLAVLVAITTVCLAGDLPTCESVASSYPQCNSGLDVVYEDYPNPLTDANDVDLPQNGWWWNPELSGEGVYIEIQQSNIYASGFIMFGSLYSYDENGDALWLTFSGPFEPYSDTSRWKQVADFRVLHPNDVAPVGTLLGTFSASLIKVNGGTCVDCGVIREPQPSIEVGSVEMTWTQPYKLRMDINGERIIELKPFDVMGEDGSFLTDGLWAIDKVSYGFTIIGNVPGTNEVDPYLYMGLESRRSIVNFNYYDVGSIWEGAFLYNDSQRTILEHIDYNEGVQCFLSSGVDSINGNRLSPIQKPYSNRNFGYRLEAAELGEHILACYYPENDTLRFIDVFYDTIGTPHVVVDLYRDTDMLAYLPKGDVKNFNAYIAASTDKDRNLGIYYSGQKATMIVYSDYSIESSGMHLSKLTEGGIAVDQMPDYSNSRLMWWGSGDSYTEARKYKSNGPLKDDIYPEQEVVNGFYSPTQYDKQKQKPYAGWFWDPSNPGWGMSYNIYTRADGSEFFFGAIFTYKENGKPVWYVLSGAYEEGKTLSVKASEFRNGTCYTCNNYHENEATGYEFDVDITWSDKSVLNMTINNTNYDMQRFDLYDADLEHRSADFLTEGKYEITGIRVEGTFKAFHDGVQWWDTVLPIEDDPYDRGYPIIRPPSENPARPQFVFSRTTAGWDKMDLSKLKTSERSRLRQTIGASDEAVFYIQDRLYDEHFMNLMTPAEYEVDYLANSYGRITFTDGSEININDKGWWNVTQDIGRMVLAYEPATNKVKIAHLGGDDIKRYPNISNGSFVLKDEFFLFEGVLGTSSDPNLELYPVSCPPGICSNPTELEQVVFNNEWYKRNFLTMNKFRAMGENISRMGDYSDWCPFGTLRKEGHMDPDLDPYTLKELSQSWDDPKFAGRCPTYFPDEAEQWYPSDWLFKTEGIDPGTFVEIYHEQ
ncbi:MAG: hypothetical protein QM504_03340 [Pseudomonadota bacterium]